MDNDSFLRELEQQIQEVYGEEAECVLDEEWDRAATLVNPLKHATQVQWYEVCLFERLRLGGCGPQDLQEAA